MSSVYIPLSVIKIIEKEFMAFLHGIMLIKEECNSSLGLRYVS